MKVTLEDVSNKASSNLAQKDIDGLIGDYPIFGASGYIGNLDFYHQEREYIAVVKDGAGVGRTMYLPAKSSVIGTLQYILPKDNIVPRYLYYAVRNMKLEKYYMGAAIPHIYYKDYKKETFELPNIDEQKRIVDILERVENIILDYKQQLEELDILIKYRFVEMFGDPIRNTQNRPTTEFINVVKMQRGFDLPVQDRQQDGDIPVFGSNGALDRHDVAKVQGGGVITGRSGTIGKVYYTEGDYWPLNTSLFSVNTHGNNIIYLAYLLQMYDLSRFTEGTGVPTLNRNKFHDKPIIDVPLNQQEQFAVFVKQIDKLKFEVQKSLDETQTLMDSLMQQYFG